jgi:pimeloyl-ACP methyl ester carboxylesterase
MDETSASRYRAKEIVLWRANGAEPVERWVDVPGHGIRVRILETGVGPPVLFVHGITTAGSIWATLVARMHGYRCLVLDRPGCGLSEPLARDRMVTPSTLVDVQVALLDALGIECADVVGSSFGGACALWLAAGRPERVGRIVLEGAPAIAGIRLVPAHRLLAAGPLGRFLASRRATPSMVRWYFRQLGHRRLEASGWPQHTDLAWTLSMADDTDTQRHDAVLMQAIATWRGFRPSALFDPADLARIDRPALWLWGTDDPLATVAQGRAWAAAMPSATFEPLTAGHVPWLDDPEGHARRLERFLAQEVRLDVTEVVAGVR